MNVVMEIVRSWDAVLGAIFDDPGEVDQWRLPLIRYFEDDFSHRCQGSEGADVLIKGAAEGCLSFRVAS